MTLEYVALGILIVVVLILFYGIIAIHDIPYDIAMHRDHPHQDAIHVAGWVSLFTLHAIWPFLWIWASLYRKDRGWGFTAANGEQESITEAMTGLQEQLKEVREELDGMKNKHSVSDSKSSVKSEPAAKIESDSKSVISTKSGKEDKN